MNYTNEQVEAFEERVKVYNKFINECTEQLEVYTSKYHERSKQLTETVNIDTIESILKELESIKGYMNDTISAIRELKFKRQVYLDMVNEME